MVEVKGKDVKVSPTTKQVAAITWNNETAGGKEVSLGYPSHISWCLNLTN